LHLVPDNPRMLSALGRATALSGKRDEARGILTKLEDMARLRYVSPLDPALIQLALGEHGPAFERLNYLCEMRCFDLIHLKVDPRFDPWHENRQFLALLRKLGV